MSTSTSNDMNCQNYQNQKVCQVYVTNAGQQQSCSIWFSAHQYYEISSQSNGKRRWSQYQFLACKMRQQLLCKYQRQTRDFYSNLENE